MLAYDRRPEGVTAGVSDAADRMKPGSLTEGEEGEGAALTEGVGYRGIRPCQTGGGGPARRPVMLSRGYRRCRRARQAPWLDALAAGPLGGPHDPRRMVGGVHGIEG